MLPLYRDGRPVAREDSQAIGTRLNGCPDPFPSSLGSDLVNLTL